MDLLTQNREILKNGLELLAQDELLADMRDLKKRPSAISLCRDAMFIDNIVSIVFGAILWRSDLAPQNADCA
jgi:hypothetical protein